MIQYDALDNLLLSDLSQLRAERNHATLPAITQFVDGINSFFRQFKEVSTRGTLLPTPQEVEIINQKLGLLFDKLSLVEKTHFATANKENPTYRDLPKDQFDKIIDSFEVQSINTLRTRMQYWAASDQFGGAIRNSREHVEAVKLLDRWDKLYVSKRDKIISIFQQGGENNIDSPPPVRRLNLFE